MTHSNPLIAKWEELNKKEEPKLKLPSEEPPKPPSLTSYDVDSGKDSFLQVAELVKQNKAKITSMSMNVDATELFTKIISFEVMVADWDT